MGCCQSKDNGSDKQPGVSGHPAAADQNEEEVEIRYGRNCLQLHFMISCMESKVYTVKKERNLIATGEKNKWTYCIDYLFSAQS